MSKIDNSGPAFPINANESADRCIYTGMTLRDYFAAKAMQATINAWIKNNIYPSTDIEVAKNAYAVADAMLEARQR
jgi:hypothetical protein